MNSLNMFSNTVCQPVLMIGLLLSFNRPEGRKMDHFSKTQALKKRQTDRQTTPINVPCPLIRRECRKIIVKALSRGGAHRGKEAGSGWLPLSAAGTIQDAAPPPPSQATTAAGATALVVAEQ